MATIAEYLLSIVALFSSLFMVVFIALYIDIIEKLKELHTKGTMTTKKGVYTFISHNNSNIYGESK